MMKKYLIIIIMLAFLLVGCTPKDWELEANNNLKNN